MRGVACCHGDRSGKQTRCCSVDARVERQEQIVMGTAGTMLDWVLKKKVSHSRFYT